jgi:DNA-binding transcriptional regulator YiaG
MILSYHIKILQKTDSTIFLYCEPKAVARLQLNIAEKIVIVRKRLHETQEVFGARFNVKKLTVNQWEGGASTPTHARLALLKKLFQEVLGEEDESQFKTPAYQLLLPFDEPIKLDFCVSSHSADRFAVEIRRRVG